MLKQMHFNRKDFETYKLPKRKETIELKYAIYQKQSKVKFPAENVVTCRCQQKVTWFSKYCFFKSLTVKSHYIIFNMI